MFGNDIDFCVSSMTLSSFPGAYILLGYWYAAALKICDCDIVRIGKKEGSAIETRLTSDNSLSVTKHWIIVLIAAANI